MLPEVTDTKIEAVQQYLEQNLSNYLDLLNQMVDINSFTYNGAGVDELGEMTTAVFTPLGFKHQTVKAEHPQHGHHLFLQKYAGADAPVVGLVSHLDTVFSEEEERMNQFHWRVEGDRAYGPGTVDIKGGTLIIYMMMDVLRTFYPDVYNRVTWEVMLDACEEAGGIDFGALCRERLPVDRALACLVFEGGYMTDDNRFKLVTARKGMAMFEVTVNGRSSHAGSSHEKGANAIVQLAHTIQQIAKVTNYDKTVTVNVGHIEGGTVINRVPHLAKASLEMRAFNLEAYHEAIQQILATSNDVIEHSADGEFSCDVDVKLTHKTAPWPANEHTEQLYQLWAQAANSLGYGTERQERGGLSDGNHTWQAVPTLDALGPDGGNAHCSERTADGKKDQEYCTISSFIPKTMLNLQAVLQLVGEVQ